VPCPLTYRLWTFFRTGTNRNHAQVTASHCIRVTIIGIVSPLDKCLHSSFETMSLSSPFPSHVPLGHNCVRRNHVGAIRFYSLVKRTITLAIYYLIGPLPVRIYLVARPSTLRLADRWFLETFRPFSTMRFLSLSRISPPEACPTAGLTGDDDRSAGRTW
jgi:hypothetical protein